MGVSPRVRCSITISQGESVWSLAVEAFNFEAMEQPHRAASPIAENVNLVIKFLEVECDFIKSAFPGLVL